jgi:hypothetical protein
LPAGWLGFPYEHKTIASIKIIAQWDEISLCCLSCLYEPYEQLPNTS